MLRLTDLSQVPADLGPTVVTLGNFDGVHRGHASVLRSVVEQARARDAKAVAVTFDPHPLEVLHPDRAPAQITALDDRVALLEQTGVDVVLVLRFDRELAAQTPEQFVKECFVDGLRARAVIVGKDTRFGVNNSGDIDTLRELGDKYAFEVLTLDDVGPGVRWSSTQVRRLLAEGRVEEVTEILGRRHRVRGVVVQGLQRGRELGFPTANLPVPKGFQAPADGVYAGWLRRTDVPDAPAWPAAISVGTNPTFDDVPETVVEAYVLDRDDLELYGVPVRVDFVQRLRGNVKFEGIPQLIDQISADVEQTRDVLGSNPSPEA